MHRFEGADGEALTDVARLRPGFKGGTLTGLGDGPDPAPADTVVMAVACGLHPLVVPFSDPRKAAQVVPFEMDGRVPFEIDRAVVVQQPLASDRDTTRMQVAALPHGRLEALMDGFGGDDQPQVILPEAVALLALGRRVLGADALSTLVLDVRPRRLLMVLAPGGLGARTVAISGDGEVPGGADKPGAPGGAAALMAVRRALQSLVLETGTAPVRIWVVGHPDAALAAALPGALGLTPVAAADLALDALGGGRVDGDRIRSHAVALGAVLAAAEDRRRMNLRSGPFALAAERGGPSLKRLAGIGVGALLVLALGWGDGWVRQQAAVTANAEAKAALVTQYRAVFPNAVRVVNPLVQAKNALKTVTSRSQVYGAGGTTPMGYLKAVSAAIPPELSVDVFDFSVEGRRLRMEAQAASFDAIDQIKQLLLALPEFSEVRVSDAKMNARGDRVKFRVHATLRDAV